MIRFLRATGEAAEPLSLAGHTVILPSLCVGNLGQLSADLIIATMRLQKSAILWHPAIVPLVGPRAFQHDRPTDTTSACELYSSPAGSSGGQQVSVLHLRTPIVPALVGEFFSQLIGELLKAQVARLIVLTSMCASEKRVVDSSDFRYLAAADYEVEAAGIFGADERRGWLRFDGDQIYGGGFARRVLEAAEQQRLPAVVLFKYLSEGDNRQDAAELVTRLNESLKQALIPVGTEGLRLTVPSSWNLLFGNSAPSDLY